MEARTIAFGVLVLLLGAAGAAGAQGAGLQAAEVRVDGAVQATGPLEALVHEGDPGAAAFTLRAESMVLERDTSAYVAAGSLVLSHGSSTSVHEYTDVMVTSLEGRSGHLLAVLPAGGGAEATLNAGPVLLARGSPSVQVHHFVDPERDDAQVPLAPSVRVDASGDILVQIQGDLHVVLWDWGIRVQGKDGGRTFDTGRAPGPGGMHGQMAQAYLTARNATLVLHGDLPEGAGLMLASVEVRGGQSVQVRAATGLLGGAQLVGEDVQVQGGHLVLRAAGMEHGMMSVELLSQDAVLVLADGHAVRLEAAAPGTAWMWHWGSALTVLLVALVVAARGASRLAAGPHGAPRLNMARNLADTGRYRLAAAVMGDVGRRCAGDVGALMLAAEVHARLGGAEAELQVRRGADAALVDEDRLENAKHVLRLLGALGRGEEAYLWLEHCQALGGPGVVEEIQRDSRYAPLQEDEGFRRRVRQAFGLEGSLGS